MYIGCKASLPLRISSHTKDETTARSMCENELYQLLLGNDFKRNRMSEKVTATMMYCRENKHILHKYYTKIAKESIVRHKFLLPTFEDENDDDSEANIDVGV
jgi:hypothetical protein